MLRRRHLLGILLVSMSTLTLEIVLTRIFSVTMMGRVVRGEQAGK